MSFLFKDSYDYYTDLFTKWNVANTALIDLGGTRSRTGILPAAPPSVPLIPPGQPAAGNPDCATPDCAQEIQDALRAGSATSKQQTSDYFQTVNDVQDTSGTGIGTIAIAAALIIGGAIFLSGKRK